MVELCSLGVAAEPESGAVFKVLHEPRVWVPIGDGFDAQERFGTWPSCDGKPGRRSIIQGRPWTSALSRRQSVCGWVVQRVVGTLVDVSPRDQSPPSYPRDRRDHFRKERAPARTVERFVPSKIISHC